MFFSTRTKSYKKASLESEWQYKLLVLEVRVISKDKVLLATSLVSFYLRQPIGRCGRIETVFALMFKFLPKISSTIP
jgi:hypothetical protein